MARLRNVLDQLNGLDDVCSPLSIKAFDDKAVKSAAADIAEELCSMFERHSQELAEEVVSPDDLQLWCDDEKRDTGAPLLFTA